MNSMTILLRIEKLEHSFERWGTVVSALQGIDFEVTEGEWLNIVGPNGSGKSTLLKMICRELQLSNGEIFLTGKSVRGMSVFDLRKQVFMVNQDPSKGTASSLTVEEHLFLAARLAGRTGMGNQDLQEVLHQFRDKVRSRQIVGTLSGGQRQLLSLVLASLTNCPLILLDEPFSALDPENSDQFLDSLKQLHKNGRTLMLVTHQLRFAVESGTRTMALAKGKIIYDHANSERDYFKLTNAWDSAASLSA